MTTVGFSKKVAAAILTACGAQAIALVVQLASSGAWDRAEWASLLGVALTATLGTYAGYRAPPNEVIASE